MHQRMYIKYYLSKEIKKIAIKYLTILLSEAVPRNLLEYKAIELQSDTERQIVLNDS